MSLIQKTETERSSRYREEASALADALESEAERVASSVREMRANEGKQILVEARRQALAALTIANVSDVGMSLISRGYLERQGTNSVALMADIELGFLLE